MKKKLTLLLLLFLSIFTFAGCSASNHRGDGSPNASGEGSGATEQSLILTDPARKIVYTVEVSIKTKDLIGTTNEIKGKLVAGEDWVEKENMTDNSNYIIFRVKTSRLNEFVNGLRNEYETTQFKLESEDVSLDYADVEAKKQVLQTTLDNLRQYKTTIPPGDITRLMQIDKEIESRQYELDRIERQLLVYNQRVGFSTVKVYIYGEKASPKPPTYDKALSNSFSNGWNAVLAILKFLGQAIATIIPFAVIIVPVGAIILGVVYRDKIKAHFKKDKKEKTPEEEPQEKENKE